MASGVRRALDGAIDRAVTRPGYAVGYLVGDLLACVALLALGRRWSRPRD